MIEKRVLDALRRGESEARERCPLKPLSTFRIGGVAELAVFPKTVAQLTEAVAILRESDTPFLVIGNGSNLLFGDGLLLGALVVTSGLSELRVEGETVFAETGVSLAALSNAAASASLTGLEFARGIPGTVGGAVFMNAGAYGGAVADVLRESRALDTVSGEILTLTEHAFGYRKSIYMEHPEWICLGGVFSLCRGEERAIRARMRELAEQRRAKQPLEYPSGGSYFKRPDGYFGGKLIEDCGLKGYAVGDAAVSEKHAGFLINRGSATAEQMLRVEAHVRETVLREFGVMLEREVRFVRTVEE